MRPALDIVIVNWNAGEHLDKCLASISRFGDEHISKVVIVDNGSSDDSLDSLGRFGLPLEIIRNDENLGFARACNQGAAVCDAHYLLFLNPDTEVFVNSFDVPLTFMEDESNQDVSICGIQLVDENGHVARSCAHFPSLWRFTAQALGLNKLPGLGSTGVHMRDWDHSETRIVDHVIGAFFLVRRNVFEALNGFDERYFVYLEDIDFSIRAKKDGWKSVFLADARAYHAGGGTSRQIKDVRLFYSLRSRLLYGLKHFPIWQTWVLLGLTLFVEPLTRSVFSLLRGGINDVRDTWKGYSMLYGDLPNILGKPDENTEV